MSTEQYDLDMLNILATTYPDPTKIDWRKEYARLYANAEEKEEEARRQIAHYQAQIESLMPSESPDRPILDCAKRLADLTGDSVSIDMATWHRRYSATRREEETEYRIYVCIWQSSVRAPTLAEAEAEVRSRWEKAHQPPTEPLAQAETDAFGTATDPAMAGIDPPEEEDPEL